MDDRTSKIIPKRFAHLMPKMKASDYDYIIFDLPVITSTSITPRISKFMDAVLMVVEAGKTNSELLRRATKRLSESQANVTAVFNKSKAVLPQWLEPEI